MTLKCLTKTLPRTEALLRVRKDKVTLNAAASRLLELTPKDMVIVYLDADQLEAGRKGLYIGKCNSCAYRLKPRGETFYICSAALSKSIADAYEGYGTYRICKEDFLKNASGEKYYNIFFKKYD